MVSIIGFERIFGSASIADALSLCAATTKEDFLLKVEAYSENTGGNKHDAGLAQYVATQIWKQR